MAIDGWVLIGVAIAMAALASPLAPAAPWTCGGIDRWPEPERRCRAGGLTVARGAGRRAFRRLRTRAAPVSHAQARPGRPADPG